MELNSNRSALKLCSMNYTQLKIGMLVLLVLGNVFMISSCKKESNVNPSGQKSISVLNSNSAFESVFEQGLTDDQPSNIPGSIIVNDFTIENTNILNIAFHTNQPLTTQIDPRRTYYRISTDLNSNTQNASEFNLGGFNPFPNSVLPIYKFFPYSNVLVGAQFSGGNGFLYQNVIFNDADMYFETAGFVGLPDMSYRNLVINESGKTNYGAFSRNTNSNTGVGAKFDMFFGTRGGNQSFYSVYNRAGNDEFMRIAIDNDSVIVEKLVYSVYGNGATNPVYKIERKNQLKHYQVVGPYNKTFRHYSYDGKLIAFALVGESTQKVNTWVYNFETNVLTQNLSNISLDYVSTDSQMDLDTDGNIYYSGYANAGSNKNGWSIYKKTGSGNSQLVGSDNFLKTGVLRMLKFLNGKVYLAISSYQTESNRGYYQLNVVREK